MVSSCSLSWFLALLVFTSGFVISHGGSNNTTFPMTCSSQSKTCNALLYHVNDGIPEKQIASSYSVNSSQIRPIMVANRQDYLITVPCSCEEVNDMLAYTYNTLHTLKLGDTLDNISDQIYSGQVLIPEKEKLYPGNATSIQLLCGCVESDSQIVITYTIQDHDTLSHVATLLSSRLSDIESMNQNLIKDPESIQEGWVLFVPMEKNGLQEQTPKKENKHFWTIIVGVVSAATIILLVSVIFILLKRKRSAQTKEEEPRAVSKSLSSNRNFSWQHPFTSKDNNIEGQTKSIRRNESNVLAFESEKAVIFTIEEIEEATNNFNESHKIGEGGYGKVYFGVIGDQEVAVKKMRSSKSKEFFAEIKVLCKIHHINVVELLGYASGDDHLYLVYEFVQNGSLSDHLHDPLLKGHQPLSWTGRTQIALDAAKGIEYIHDHTKARYVHRDIKTTNILLDEGLRAKVADFGLAKLVGRTNEEDLIATRLVGTPGYLPPESVKELQVTSKTDVFAFGVVLAELITGQRALVRDKQQPNKTISLIKIINMIFEDEDPESALEAAIDENLRRSYPLEELYKMAEIAACCLNEEAVNRPEMREVVAALSQIMDSTKEWEASLGGNSQVFSGIFSGR